MRCVFMGVPQLTVSPYPFAKGVMETVTSYTYVWAGGEVLTVFVLMLILWLIVSGKMLITEGRKASIYAFMLMTGADLVDYFLRGNCEWFIVGDYPITNNVFTLPTYAILTWNAEEGEG